MEKGEKTHVHCTVYTVQCMHALANDEKLPHIIIVTVLVQQYRNAIRHLYSKFDNHGNAFKGIVSRD